MNSVIYQCVCVRVCVTVHVVTYLVKEFNKLSSSPDAGTHVCLSTTHNVNSILTKAVTVIPCFDDNGGSHLSRFVKSTS